MMSVSSRTALRIVLVSLLVLGGVSASFADEASVRNEKNTNGFFPAKTPWFNDGDATTVFAKEPAKTDSPEVGFYKEKEEEEEELLEDQPQIMQAKNAKPPFDTRTASPEQITRFYGDPSEDPALLPEDKAPTPFKAMGAALDSGNEELAFQYAKQYVRYIAGTSERVKAIGQMTDLALEREGIRPSSIKDNPYQKLMNDDLKAAEDDPKGRGRQSKISALLQKAADAERMPKNRINPDIPVDPKGEVQVLFFFDPAKKEARILAPRFENVRRHYENDSHIKVTGYSVSANATPEQVDAFANEFNLGFQLLQRGVQVANALSVKEVPSVLLLAPNAQKTYEINGDLESSEIISAISQMKGAGDDA